MANGAAGLIVLTSTLPQDVVDVLHPRWDWWVQMAALRTTRFFLGVVSGTAVHDLYTVPTGKRVILKFVTVQEVSGSSCTAQLRLSPLGTIFTWSLVAYAAAGSRDVGNFWIVVNEGEKIQMARSTSGDITVTISGSIHDV